MQRANFLHAYFWASQKWENTWEAKKFKSRLFLNRSKLFHRDRCCSSGIDHDQMSSWSLECRHDQFNDPSILHHKKIKKMNELSRNRVKTFSVFLNSVIKKITDSSNVKFRHLS